MSAMATPSLIGRTVGVAGDAHQPRLSLNHRVVSGLRAARSGLPETGNRAVDRDEDIVGRECFVRQTQPVHRSRAGSSRPARPRARAAHSSTGRADATLEIERQAFLVAIDAQEIRALAVDERRTPRARVVAAPGLLELDDAGAHVGEQHRAVRARQHPGEVEDGQSRERRVSVDIEFDAWRQRSSYTPDRIDSVATG